MPVGPGELRQGRPTRAGIADRTLIPEASQRHYSEKIVYLPDSCQAAISIRHTNCETTAA
jgi:predicted O-linked N-acetylglucosamine transferase (SPINDLY family)